MEKFFDMACVPEEKHDKFMAYKLKGEVVAWWDQLVQGHAKASH